MRSFLCVPMLRGLALCGVLMLPAGMAVAQDKLAPTRSYGRDAEYGKNFGATYSSRSRLPPEKGFGLPAMARPGAGPEQQQGLVKGATPPASPLPQDQVTPTPGGSGGVDANSFGLPELAPNHEGVPPASASSNTDFFARTMEFDLPKTAGDTETSDTPLYTTQDPAAAGGMGQLQPGASTFGAGLPKANTFGSASFGTPQPGDN